jgi:UPF0755 protein
VTDDSHPAGQQPETGPTIGRAGRVNKSESGTESTLTDPVMGRPDAPRPPRSGSRLITALLGVLLVAVAAVVVVAYLLSPPSATPTVVEFEVLPGWGGSKVAAELADAGLVRSAPLFGAYLRVRDLDHSIGEGLYDLTPAMSAADIAERLVAGGRPRVVSIAVPEGWRAANVVERLAANGVSTATDLAALVADPAELGISFLPPERPLEGFLFPAVYEVPLKAEASEALALMVERFGMELDDIAPAERLEELGLSVYGWVTLASMVQAEAASDEEMPIIAGVFANRLELGMLLQSDPTVAYGLGKQLPELSAVAGDLQVDTPWNTYTRAGLPFSPIGNPGREALLAVLSPERYTSDGALYLYFLHGTDAGVPVFRPNTNLPAHNSDVETYLRNDGRR